MVGSGTEKADRSVPYYRAFFRSFARGGPSAQDGQNLRVVVLKPGILLDSSNSVCSELFHVYAACGSPATALRASQGIPSAHRAAVDWTALLSCHSRHDLYADVLRLFRTMETEDCAPGDEANILCVLGVCALLRDSPSGTAVHLRILKRGLPFTGAASNAVTDMYAECGRMVHAWKMVDEMAKPMVVPRTVILPGSLLWQDSARLVIDVIDQKNEVASTVMVAAYIEADLPREALALLAQMLLSPCYGSDMVKLNHVALCSILRVLRLET